MVNGLSMLETALFCLKWVKKKVAKGLYMWEMRYIWGNRLKHSRNG